MNKLIPKYLLAGKFEEKSDNTRTRNLSVPVVPKERYTPKVTLLQKYARQYNNRSLALFSLDNRTSEKKAIDDVKVRDLQRQQLKKENDKYIAAVAYPVGIGVALLIPGVNILTNLGLAGLSAHNLLSDNGLKKTWNAFNESRYGDFAKSALGDVLDASVVLGGGYGAGRQALNYSVEPLSKNLIVKRGIEAMSLTRDINPVPSTIEYLKSIFNPKLINTPHPSIPNRKYTPIELSHLSNTLKYIFTGKGNSRNAYFAPRGTGYQVPTDTKTGYLRALLYGEEPGSDLKFLGTADEIEVGPHYNTIIERGYNPKDIRVYSTELPFKKSYLFESEDLLQLNSLLNDDAMYKNEPMDGYFETKNNRIFDAAGHRKFIVGKNEMHLDFTDFNFGAYGKKYGIENPIIKFGLKVVDKATTPIIVRTKWGTMFKPKQQEQFTWKINDSPFLLKNPPQEITITPDIFYKDIGTDIDLNKFTQLDISNLTNKNRFQ